MKKEKGPEGVPTEPTKAFDWASQPDWACCLPDRLREVWPWFAALWAFDYGDPLPLVDLIRNGSIPAEFVGAVADIVAGRRKPNLRAAAKAKIPAAERAEVATLLSVSFGFRESIKYRASPEHYAVQGVKPGATAISYRSQREPIEIMRSADKLGRKVIDTASKRYGVSHETIENLLREAKERLARWPSV